MKIFKNVFDLFFKQITKIWPSASQEYIIHLHLRNQNNQQHTISWAKIQPMSST